MKAARRIALLLSTLLLTLGASVAEPSAELPPVDPADPAWQKLAARLSALPDGRAEFTEERLFRFRSKPVQLEGVARVSAQHGLSLEYTRPEPRTVIVDNRGVLFREAGRDRPGPNDARARAINDAMLKLLRFELGGLGEAFAVSGRIAGEQWQLSLVPKGADLRGTVFFLAAAGDGGGVNTISVFQQERRIVEIRIQPPQPVANGFSAEEVRRYFRGSP